MGDPIPIKALTKPTLPVDDDLVSGLEALLEMARAGEIQGIAYATVSSVGAGSYTQAGSGWRGAAAETNFHVVLGAISVLEARYMAGKI